MSERERQFIIEIFNEKIPRQFKGKVILATYDALVQFAQNPTSMSAGYGIEENYPLIAENLSKRYKLDKITIELILTFLKDLVNKMREIRYNIYFWRDALKDHIKRSLTIKFTEWCNQLYENLAEEDRPKFLFFLYALRKTSSIRDIHKWFVCFFDKEEKSSEDSTRDLLVQFGLGNILYYRSTSGYVENQFVPSIFNEELGESFKNLIPVQEENVKKFFDGLAISDIKKLERCMIENVPVLGNRLGRVTQTCPLIVESSKSFFAVSPFALDAVVDLIKAKKLELTKEWKNKFDTILNSFVKKVHPCAEVKVVFEIDGAYCWEIRYVDDPEKEPLSVSVLLSPYLFPVSGYSNILSEMRRVSTSLNLIFLIKENLPTITESFRYVSKRNLIFLLDEGGTTFNIIERSGKLPNDKALIINSFLSRFLPILESEVQTSKTWPSHLKRYLENLKYYNKFPLLVEIQNRLPAVELKLRENIRRMLEEKIGNKWKDEVKKQLPEKVKKFERVIEKRPDKKESKDFLDGATIGELLEIGRKFSDILPIDKIGMVHLSEIISRRKVLEHPLKDQDSDLDKKTYNTLQSSLDYVEKVICE